MMIAVKWYHCVFALSNADNTSSCAMVDNLAEYRHLLAMSVPQKKCQSNMQKRLTEKPQFE
jgi:hypothetical protein